MISTYDSSRIPPLALHVCSCSLLLLMMMIYLESREYMIDGPRDVGMITCLSRPSKKDKEENPASPEPKTHSLSTLSSNNPVCRVFEASNGQCFDRWMEEGDQYSYCTAEESQGNWRQNQLKDGMRMRSG